MIRSWAMSSLWAAALLAASSFGCSEPTDPPPDAAADGDGDVDSDGDGDGEGDVSDGDVDGDGEGDGAPPDPDPGPLTFVADDIVSSVERRCDVDGDGTLDNAFADLGPSADMAASTFTALVRAGFSNQVRIVVHIPWVADRTAPSDAEVAFITFSAKDTDEPADPLDDFSGAEGFWARPAYLDGCGEPLLCSREVSIDDGAITVEDVRLVLPVREGIALERGVLEGTIAPGGAGLEAVVCGATRVAALGGVAAHDELGDISVLEMLLAGGALFGIPALPGMPPDLDFDGDGLETFVLDADSHLARCIDGDRTIIDGRDCWQDPRIADAYSINYTMTAVPAVYAGRQPGWQDHVEGDCPDGPPEPSAWDPL